MRFHYRSRVLMIAVLGGLLASSVEAGITISKCAMVNKTAGGELTWGMADAYLSIDFVSAATTDCETGGLTYVWDFGDGTTATGQNVSHTYGAANAGCRDVTLTVYDNCCNEETANVSLSAVSGIDIVTAGNTNRLSFDDVRNVEANPLPAGVCVGSIIDWYLAVGTGTSKTANMNSGNVNTLSAFPNSNSSWGNNTLTAYIDTVMVPGQDGELELTGTVSLLWKDLSIKVFYEGTGNQSPGTDPNWFYYYKDNAGGGAYTYKAAGRSSSTSGGGLGTVKIANEAYAGDEYITHNYTNPGGRLKATGWSTTNRYYANFLGVLAHETQHATNESTVGDTDGDDLPDAFETGTSLTDKNVINSAIGGGVTFNDDEIYAGGPVEKGGIDGANTTNDWAHPGTNWP